MPSRHRPQEELSRQESVLRCAGAGGLPHYFHTECLLQWVKHCVAKGVDPTCPTCRGPLQVHSDRMEAYLGRNSASLAAEDVRVLEELRNSGPSPGPSGAPSEWAPAPLKAKDLLAVLGIGAAALAVKGLKALQERHRMR